MSKIWYPPAIPVEDYDGDLRVVRFLPLLT